MSHDRYLVGDSSQLPVSTLGLESAAIVGGGHVPRIGGGPPFRALPGGPFDEGFGGSVGLHRTTLSVGVRLEAEEFRRARHVAPLLADALVLQNLSAHAVMARRSPRHAPPAWVALDAWYRPWIRQPIVRVSRRPPHVEQLISRQLAVKMLPPKNYEAPVLLHLTRPDGSPVVP